MQLRCGSTRLDLTRPAVMGVLNVTPDSFSDGGRYLDLARALFAGEAARFEAWTADWPADVRDHARRLAAVAFAHAAPQAAVAG